MCENAKTIQTGRIDMGSYGWRNVPCGADAGPTFRPAQRSITESRQLFVFYLPILSH